MFCENTRGALVYMTSTLIKSPHAFTTRLGGVSEGHLSSLNFGEGRGDDIENVRENYRRAGELFGVGADAFAVTRQEHGTVVRAVTPADRHVVGESVPYEADGLVTATKNLPIAAFTADCVPVLLEDAENAVVAAVHCGWRGSVDDIIGEAVKAMVNLGAKTPSIRAAVGPAIGFCCFETDSEVPDAVEDWLYGDTAGLFRKKENGKTLVDLRGANRRRLLQIGVDAANIDVSEECTFCQSDKYWSHRKTNGNRGSMAAIIMLKGEGM